MLVIIILTVFSVLLESKYNNKQWTQLYKYQIQVMHYSIKCMSSHQPVCECGWGIMLQAGKVACFIPIEVIDFFNLPDPSSHIMALGLTQPLTDMSTRNLPGGLKHCQHVRLTIICEPTV
jgi:hypothetical protein